LWKIKQSWKLKYEGSGDKGMPNIISGFKPYGGKHCITTALKQIFDFYKHPITEEMIFGIGSGLAFTYLNLAKSPMLSGRIKPFEFEAKLAERLNIKIKCKTSKDAQKVLENTIKMLDDNQPILIYVDMPYLEYLGLDQNSHFGGHSVVLFGYDDVEHTFYVSDRDNHDYPIRTPKGNIASDYHIVSYEEIEKARSSNNRPFPANNKYLEFDFNGYEIVTPSIIIEAIQETCDTMLKPPANLLGVNGIKKFSKEILKWNKFDEEKLRLAGVTNYFMINADGGTGGGIFRKMYGQFLIQSSEMIQSTVMEALGNRFIEISEQWDLVANLMWKLSETGNPDLLKEMSLIIMGLYHEEVDTFTELQKIHLEGL